MRKDRLIMCAHGHTFKMSELHVHPECWTLAEMNKIRCPECHSKTTWSFAKPQKDKVRVKIEEYGRLGYNNWISSLDGRIDSDIVDKIVEILGVPKKEVARMTCNVLQMRANSVTGDDYLAAKVIKYKITGTLQIEAQLVDDFEIDDIRWSEQAKRERISYKLPQPKNIMKAKKNGN